MRDAVLFLMALAVAALVATGATLLTTLCLPGWRCHCRCSAGRHHPAPPPADVAGASRDRGTP